MKLANDKTAQLHRALVGRIPADRLIRDRTRCFAYGTDASFYRLTPQMVVRAECEDDVVAAMQACSRLGIPFTFRAAGTSLSGQAVSDSVLIQLSRQWNGIEIRDDGKIVHCEPAALGADVNRALSPFQRKIGPDPASIDAAMVAGIAANNASGMCCGNVDDSYHTLAALRIVFADGFVLDTASEQSRKRFHAERTKMADAIDTLGRRVRQNPALSDRIRRKYRIKNTMGYSLNALLDHSDPVDVIAHLLIGSEGTLGFISQITYNTVSDHPFAATALVLFPDIQAACEASFRLSRIAVSAIELMDRQSLRAVEAKPGIPEAFRTLSDKAAALLVEVRGGSSETTRQNVMAACLVLEACRLEQPPSFTENRFESKRLWEIRKGLFPSLGYHRETGSTIVIEDVAFHPEQLAEAAMDLRGVLDRHGYDAAVIFGHALQGNLHFVFCADFNRPEEVGRYESLLNDVVSLVTDKYEGSLKGEHGTGRNMAPFVAREWGSDAFEVIREIKNIFDPEHLLNPGVILNNDPKAHISNLKRTPRSHALIEKCTECGFCEPTCPSRNLSLTPRQRIAVWREISGLSASKEDRLLRKQFRDAFDYQGDQTCAVDGLCATRCPVGIDTGAFIKELRRSGHSAAENFAANVIAKNINWFLAAARFFLNSVDLLPSILSPQLTKSLLGAVQGVIADRKFAWNPWIPPAASQSRERRNIESPDKVVYFPSCVSRVFGASRQSPYSDSQIVCIDRLLTKAGYEVLRVSPEASLCCGMAFSSKGYVRQGDWKRTEIVAELTKVSENGRYPVVTDTSPCAQRLWSDRSETDPLPVYDLAEFLLDFVTPRVNITKKPGHVAVHMPCSLRKSGQEAPILELAKLCMERVSVPASAPCCGFAGDRGFTHPELTASALVSLKTETPADCHVGYSTSRTCEIGVSLHSGISYQSIAYLVDEVSQKRSLESLDSKDNRR